MLKLKFANNEISGFTYTPVLEYALGLFLTVVSAAVVGFYFWGYFADPKGSNHNWGDIILTLAVVAFFGKLGFALMENYMKVTFSDGSYRFYQCMRKPDCDFTAAKEDYGGCRIEKKTEGYQNCCCYVLLLKNKGQEIDFYSTVNQSEAEELCNALNALGKNNM